MDKEIFKKIKKDTIETSSVNASAKIGINLPSLFDFGTKGEIKDKHFIKISETTQEVENAYKEAADKCSSLLDKIAKIKLETNVEIIKSKLDEIMCDFFRIRLAHVHKIKYNQAFEKNVDLLYVHMIQPLIDKIYGKFFRYELPLLEDTEEMSEEGNNICKFVITAFITHSCQFCGKEILQIKQRKKKNKVLIIINDFNYHYNSQCIS